MERTETSSTCGLGTKMPEFSLPATDGHSYTNSYFDGAKACLVIFTCNHCPYVKGSEKQMNTTIVEHLEAGLKVIAISSNDAEKYPDDSFEKMKEKSSELNLPYPYLYDETQAVAKSFDAACTPECYLFDGDKKLVFHGTINNSPRHPEEATENYLTKAVAQVLSGEAVEPSFVHPMGCSIKWKA